MEVGFDYKAQHIIFCSDGTVLYFLLVNLPKFIELYTKKGKKVNCYYK